mmetsp:Transcript_1458/g.3220  ORF Transcript_1458/g.3220 Transcript_1458/m.3220 type:complete len:926 (-) Transcript_1458:552-3329(-)
MFGSNRNTSTPARSDVSNFENQTNNTDDGAAVASSSDSIESTPFARNSNDRSARPFYGDLVCAAAFTAIVPIDGWKAAMTCEEENDAAICRTAVVSVVSCALYGGLNWLAYLRHSNVLSFCAFLAGMWLCAFNNLNQWPYVGECVITYQFQGVLVGCLSNGALSFLNQLTRCAIMFVVASFVSIRSPFSVYLDDVLPLLGGPVLLAISILAVTRIDWTFLKDVNWNVLTVQGSRWVLAAIYMYHVACELLSMTFDGVDTQDMFRTIVKASFVACVGVASTGAFQNEIDLNEKLEVMVKNRTKIIQEKNDKLHMVELALRASETAIAITDSDLRIIWLNAACEDISSPIARGATEREETTGSSQLHSSPRKQQERQSLLGRPIVEVLALGTIRDEKKLEHAFSKSRREDEISINEMIFRLEVSPYDYSSPAMEKSTGSNNHNDSSRFLVVLKNITAERAREVAEKTAQEETMLAKAMGDSMVTLTHELRTPMQGIMGVTGMLLQQKQNADTVLVESLRLIMASSGLLLNLINNLLDVKKINSKMMDEFPLSSVVATSAIQDTIDFCLPLASISGVDVVTDYGENKKNDYQVVSNSLRLQQILINLVSNAIKYTSEQSQIRISIQPTVISDVELKMECALSCSRDTSNKNINDSHIKESLPSNAPVLCFSISDCGPGIAPHQADRLFRRFARLDSTPTRALGGSNKVGQPSGTGLGLNLCQLFVQRMNGEIWAINNSNGRGATFTFFLPLAVDSHIDSPIMTPTSLTRKRCNTFEDLANRTTLLRVLLADDVLINRKVIGRMLQQVGISDIVTVDSGETALCKLSENEPFDLVITDLQMPGMSGTELCEAIMLDKTYSSGRPPIVVGLTADTSVKVAENCRASGMSTVLYKPISVVEVQEFFERTIMQLRPGVWYTGRGNTTILSAQ